MSLRGVWIAASGQPVLLRVCVPFCLFCVASGPIAAPATQVPLAPPAASSMPAGSLGDAIREGQSIVNDTQTRAKRYVGNSLNCVSCHLDGGRAAYAAPLVGLTGVFPEYRARRGRVESLEERLNDCFVRSMNGRALPQITAEIIGLRANIAWV
jgi:thiosulfate dehydrogenase